MLFNYIITLISLLTEYVYLYIPFCISVLICILLFGIVTLITYKQYDLEKISAYECGFHPYEDTREKFNIRFYLVSILFIIFDIEVTYLFPWAVCLSFMDFYSFFVMIVFLVILTLGFIYEWKKGALDW